MNKLIHDANMAMGFDRSETSRIEWNLTEDETYEALRSRIDIAATIISISGAMWSQQETSSR